ncbi:MAG: transposase [Bacteroidetes bacterium]|nr:transposase [Bacteroidota bacterium]
MGLKNPIHPEGTYYLTLTVVDWVDIFTRPVYRHIIVDALAYCQREKGLILHAWVVMSNHIHLIASAAEGHTLSDFLRDFKKYTSKKILDAIKEVPESRRAWMLNRFEYAGRHDPKIKNYRFWQEGNEAKELVTHDFAKQKLDYLHENPVRAEWVDKAVDYRYSSAIDYAGGRGILRIDFLS